MKRPASGEDVRKLAHDFNNLLTAIIGAADAILQRSEIDPETRADVAHIREGAHRGTTLVRRLRGATQDVADPPGLISVNETIRATWRLLDHRLGANIALAQELREPGALVAIDPSQLDRALLNLIANARHAMPDGGTVTLGTSRRVVAVAESRVPDTIPPGNYVVIVVEDGGAGIPHEQMSRIFKAGFSSRRPAGGSGIGLSSTREIVRQANGFLSVESVEGQGTRFEIHLPCVESAPALIQPMAAAMNTAPTVLLIEDDLLVRNVTERTLLRAGWNVLCAISAEEALEVLREGKCDLIISDIALPGMHGVALARLVRERLSGVPIILTSGYERSAMDEAGDVMNVVFLTKPYGQTELLEAVSRIARQTAAKP
jgi:two-component system, cell cycle sensor histidine kinase and response regulator CckA